MKITLYDPDDDEPTPSSANSQSDSFTLNWVDQLGWKKNPFTAHDHYIAGFEEQRQEINLFFIKKHSFGTIRGQVGFGKTTLLNWLTDNLLGQKMYDVIKLDAEHIRDEKHLREEIADTKRSFFTRATPITTADLCTLLQKKTRDDLAVLVDNAHELSDESIQVLEAISKVSCATVVVTTTTQLKTTVEDTLEVVLSKPSLKEFTYILKQRIAAVGGQEITPFTQSIVKRMVNECSSVREFLAFAHETAVAIALKHVTLEEDESDEEIALEAEKHVKEETSSLKGRKKTKYDDLIESLSEELQE